ncbi:MAG: zinc-ribbon domain-containing protein [Dehalococcoidia bacterium]|nr:zinc-ribbon domain-containing protein [Dehalococcoidia bacterium]
MIQKAHCRSIFAIFSAIAVLAVLAGPLSPMPASAASEPERFKNVVLSIFPEYDDPLGIGAPTVLVMLDGQIQGATPPTTVRFLVPFTANMYSAGSGPRSQYQGGPPNRKASDIPGWDEISYELKTSSFVVEYYAPIPASPDRSFSAVFMPLYPIDGLQVIVQQPRQATGFSVLPQNVPATEQRVVDSEGFNIVRYSYPGLSARQSLNFDLSYNRTTTSPSLQVKDSASNNGMTIVVVIAAVVLIGFGLYWVLMRKSPKKRKGRMRGKPPQAGKATVTRFCPSCGAKMDKAARFCPECGAKQRLE